MTVRWNVVVERIVMVKVKWLESVEDEVSHVLVHVGLEDAPVKVVDCSTTVHHLGRNYLLTFIRVELERQHNRQIRRPV